MAFRLHQGNVDTFTKKVHALKNYRIISIVPQASKMMIKIIMNRIKEKQKNVIHANVMVKAQFGVL